MRSSHANRFKSAITVTRSDEQTIEVAIGRRRSWKKLGADVGKSLVFAMVCAAAAGIFLDMAHGTWFRVSGTKFEVFVSIVFYTAVAIRLAAIARHHFRRTAFRISRDALAVRETPLFGNCREWEWPRSAIFEARRSRGQFHVRLRLAPPCRLLKHRARWEIDEAVAVVNEALAAVPQASLVGTLPPEALMYQAVGESHEIEIQPISDGVRIVIPGEGESSELISPVAVVAFAIMFAVQMIFAPSFLKLIAWPLGFVAFVAIPMAFAVAFSSIFMRKRQKQPLTIVAARYVQIDHPGLPLRRRTWRREEVADVFIDHEKNGYGQVLWYFVRMMTHNRQSITFCHDRDSVERRRVVEALRDALKLPPLPDEAFPED